MICLDCGADFTEMDQTNQEYRNGQCPECRGEDIKEKTDDVREHRGTADDDRLPCRIS